MPPLRCDECGRFVAFADIEAGIALHKLTQPDHYCGSEAFETLCKLHSPRSQIGEPEAEREAEQSGLD